jgi:hypothetical protein
MHVSTPSGDLFHQELVQTWSSPSAMFLVWGLHDKILAEFLFFILGKFRARAAMVSRTQWHKTTSALTDMYRVVDLA